jgi:DNA-directed RNA polymerase subunit D
MRIINKKDNQIIFVAEIDESLANAIRRCLNQIPVNAIDEVEISKNDSPLYDETIAHRIGLIPLKMDKLTDKKTVDKLKLSVKKEGMVYSEELISGLKIVYDKIPITSLKKGQELEIIATTKVGKGEEHAKFSPGLMFYRNIVEIKIDKDCPKEVVSTCPQKILKAENGKIIAEGEDKCDMCEACVELCEKQGKNSIKLIPTKELMITLESFGQLTVEEILKKSVKELKKDLAEVSKKISK